ncbi:unnamed protein product [Brassica napus]|uniref:(rape) hypothetical protein n=1 Tax=Brassica napus TaxID=3708 RepID=A0A816KK41_BRANA|nr:unnamed protein product [Brassica napus]
MAPLMCSSPPSRLCLPSSPSRLRPLPDPPPCTPLHLPLEAPSPLEPPDPPDSPFHFLLHLTHPSISCSFCSSTHP